MRYLWILVAASVALGACSAGDDAIPALDPNTSTTAAVSTTSIVSTTETPAAVSTAAGAPETTTSLEPEPELELPPQLNGQFDVREVTLDGDSWTVAIADTPALRSQGLMNVTDLLDLDGMVFVWSDEVEWSFWMKDTLIPLDIAFFDGDGAVVGVLTMEPCRTDPCETYEVGVPFRFALEARAGALGELSDGAVLSFD